MRPQCWRWPRRRHQPQCCPSRRHGALPHREHRGSCRQGWSEGRQTCTLATNRQTRGCENWCVHTVAAAAAAAAASTTSGRHLCARRGGSGGGHTWFQTVPVLARGQTLNRTRDLMQHPNFVRHGESFIQWEPAEQCPHLTQKEPKKKKRKKEYTLVFWPSVWVNVIDPDTPSPFNTHTAFRVTAAADISFVWYKVLSDTNTWPNKIHTVIYDFLHVCPKSSERLCVFVHYVPNQKKKSKKKVQQCRD